MWRYLAGGFAVLLLAAAATLLMRGKAETASALFPDAGAAQARSAAPIASDALPEASPQTREQRRFARYDKDENQRITREEYLANRRKLYARLDANGDGVLQFDEWSAKAIARFATADADHDGAMNPAEFATTAVKRRPRPVAPGCPPGDRAPGESEG